MLSAAMAAITRLDIRSSLCLVGRSGEICEIDRPPLKLFGFLEPV
jgi:hypothetical protein